MRDLTLPQTNWDEIEAFETELLRQKTIQEKVLDYLELVAEFGNWDEKIEAYYQAEREAALIELQERLARLQRYRVAHGITTD